MNKLKKTFIKKTIASLFIANITLVTSTSLCMSTVFTQSTRQSFKSVHQMQRRRYTCQLPLSETCYTALCKENKKNEERLRLLRNNSSSNLREIWRLEDRIRRNRRRLAYSINKKSSIFDETTE